MPLVVEDGSVVDGAESYVSVIDAAAYAESRGLAFQPSPEASAEAALRRATTWLDATYRSRFTGRRRNGRAQSLEWPRIDAEDAEGNAISDEEVPVEIVHACCEAAVRELANPGALSPDVTLGRVMKSASVDGAVSVEFMAVGGVEGQRPIASVIDDILGSLIGQRPGTTRVTFFGRA